MKKLSCLFLSLVLCSCLYSVSYSSNALGQFKGEDLTNSIYTVSLEENVKSIFKEGVLYKTVTETEVGNTLSVTEKNFLSDSETVYVYEKGLIKSVTEGSTCTSYIYDNNSSLDYIVISKDGQIEEIQYFLKNPVDGSLVGVRRYDSLYLYSEDYVISQDKVLYAASGLVMTDQPFVLNENNQIEVTYDDGKTNVYAGDGKLVRSSFEDKDVWYEYDENGSACKTITNTGNSKTVDYYKNNEIFKSEQYLNDQLQDITEYNIDGYYKIQKIYRNSVHVATVWYEKNSVSATRIEYLGGMI